MNKMQPSHIILSIVSLGVFCGGVAMAQAVQPVTEASAGISALDILSIIASLIMVVYLAMPYFKKSDDKSKTDKK